MSEATLEKFSCDACSRSYSWKEQLAGKRVKCKCGSVMTVPAALKPENSDFSPEDDDGGFDLDALARADARAVESTANHVAEARIIPMAEPVARPSRGTINPNIGQPLGYQTTVTAKQQQRAAELRASCIDPIHDIYVPVGLAIVGFSSYVANYVTQYHYSSTGLGFVCVGITILTLIKAAGLIVFALAVAGPLGVSFGTLWTAVLKLGAIAILSDGCTSWIFTAASHGHSGGAGAYSLTFVASYAIYLASMAYLFHMEVMEARMVVAVLTICDRLLRAAVIIFIAYLLGVGGFASSSPRGSSAASAASSVTSGFGAATARPRHSVYTEEVGQYKEFKQWREAKQYIADGHSAFLKDTVDAMYAAGAPDIGFEVSKDINGHGGAFIMMVEMPTNPAARQKILQLRHDVRAANQMFVDPSDLIDHPDDDYIAVGLR